MAEKHPVRGILAGMIGGLVASWVMNEFTAAAGPKLAELVETSQEQQVVKSQSDSEDATMKAADAIAGVATGGQHLTHEERAHGGPMVHYAFGALMGGVYGGLAEYSAIARSGFGTTFGSALFAGGDLVAVPALHFSQPLSDFPASSFASPYAAHLAYGLTTELVRRLVRKVL